MKYYAELQNASYSMRTITKDMMFYDKKLFAGDKVLLWLLSANRDQSIFDQPDLIRLILLDHLILTLL
jgi:cytochrome P450